MIHRLMLRSVHELAAIVESLEEETLDPYVNEQGPNVRQTSTSPNMIPGFRLTPWSWGE